MRTSRQSSPVPTDHASLRSSTPALLRASWTALARTDLAFFCQYVHRGRWKRAPHLELVCKLLEDVERGNVKRLILTMPPRHGKSMTVTESFPAWFLGHHPDARVIEVSYSDALSRDFGEKVRRKIEEFGPEIFNVKLDRGRADKSDWGIEGHSGGMVSSGVGGAITGKGADLMIIDDPVKNRQEADSETYRERLWSEWQATLSTRLHPGARVVVVLTRWHEDDLAGRLLAHSPEAWRVVNLPAISEGEGDPLGRAEGEPLWPEWFDADALAQMQKTAGSRDWAALYQGHPAPAEGSIIRRGWWQEYPLAPQVMAQNTDRIIQSWDCTFKDSATSDYVVGQVWGVRGANAYLLDQIRAQMDFPTTVRAVKALSAKWPRCAAKLIEDKANGTAVLQTLRREVPGLIPVEPEGGKVARVNAVAPFIEAGNVYLPAQEPWVGDFVEECASFPGGKHDDQVDAMSQALTHLLSRPQAARVISRPRGL